MKAGVLNGPAYYYPQFSETVFPGARQGAVSVRASLRARNSYLPPVSGAFRAAHPPRTRAHLGLAHVGQRIFFLFFIFSIFLLFSLFLLFFFFFFCLDFVVLFKFENCSYFEFYSYFENCSYFDFCTNLKIVHISNLFIYEICFYIKNVYI
jgi:hypothetical protein